MHYINNVMCMVLYGVLHSVIFSNSLEKNIHHFMNEKINLFLSKTKLYCKIMFCVHLPLLGAFKPNLGWVNLSSKVFYQLLLDDYSGCSIYVLWEAIFSVNIIVVGWCVQ
jgi:hypothetical protein